MHWYGTAIMDQFRLSKCYNYNLHHIALEGMTDALKKTKSEEQLFCSENLHAFKQRHYCVC